MGSQRAFQVCDTDEGGTISAMELHSVLRATGATDMSVEQLTQLLGRAESRAHRELAASAAAIADVGSFAREFAPIRVGKRRQHRRQHSASQQQAGKRRSQQMRAARDMVVVPLSRMQMAIGRAIRSAVQRRGGVGVLGSQGGDDIIQPTGTSAEQHRAFDGVLCQFGTPRGPFVPVSLSIDEGCLLVRILRSGEASVISLCGASVGPPRTPRVGYPYTWCIRAAQPDVRSGMSKFTFAAAAAHEAGDWQTRLRAQCSQVTASVAQQTELADAGLGVMNGELDLLEFRHMLKHELAPYLPRGDCRRFCQQLVRLRRAFDTADLDGAPETPRTASQRARWPAAAHCDASTVMTVTDWPL